MLFCIHGEFLSTVHKSLTVAPAFRCETGRENVVVQVISLTIQSVYSVAIAML